MTHAEPFDAVEIIATKRDKGELADAQIDWVVDAYTRGVVADEQMSALAMAILLNGMNRREIARWTHAMIDSGERMQFSALSWKTADKHSTGGVGDKITLPLAPLVAACGVAVPQLSGRGLGHTGGTLDKLESIPGWRASLTNAEMLAQLESVGAVICAAGAGLAPADKKLYALRDVTGTVEAIPLIASSIMSKKIAEGTGALVLDVKVGSGAFMKNVDQARELAETMVGLGTDPVDVLNSGRAMDVWRRMIAAQGGDPDAALPTPQETHTIVAPASGVLTRLDALAVGVAAWRLGAGRSRPGEQVQAAAGVIMHAKPGDAITAGQPVLTLHTDTPDRFERAKAALENGYDIGTGSAEPPSVVIDRIG